MSLLDRLVSPWMGRKEVREVAVKSTNETVVSTSFMNARESRIARSIRLNTPGRQLQGLEVTRMGKEVDPTPKAYQERAARQLEQGRMPWNNHYMVDPYAKQRATLSYQNMMVQKQLPVTGDRTRFYAFMKAMSVAFGQG